MSNDVQLGIKADTSDLDKLNSSLGKTETAVKKVDKATDDLSGTLDGLKSFGGPVGEIARRFEDLQSRVAGANKAIAGVAGNLGGLAAGFAGIATAGGLLVGVLGAVGVGLAFSYRDKINELQDLGEMYGLSATQVSIFSKTLEAAGTNFQTYTNVLQKVASVATDAANGSKAQAAAFEELGVSVLDTKGNLKSNAEIAQEVVRAFDESDQSTQKLAAATDILGKNFRESAVAIRQAAEAQKVLDKFQASGIGISEKGAEATGTFAAAAGQLQFIMEVLGSQLVATVVPIFTDLINVFVRSATEGGTLAGVFTVIKASTEIVAGAIRVLATVLIGLLATFEAVGKVAGGLFAGIAEAIQGNFGSAANIFKAVGSDLVDITKRTVDDVKKLWSAAGDSFDKAITPPKVVGQAAAAFVPKVDEEAAKKAADALKKAQESYQKLLETADKAWTNITDRTLELFGVDTERLALIREMDKLIEEENKLRAAGVPIIGQSLTALKEAALQQYDRNKALEKEQALTKAITEERKRQKDLIDQATVRSVENLQNIQRSFNERFQTSTERRASEQRASVRQPFESAQASLRAEISQLDPADPATEASKKAKEQAIADLEERKRAVTEAVDFTIAEQERLDSSVDEGIMRGLTKALDTIPTLAEGISSVVANASKSLEDGLFSLFTTGEFNVKSFFSTLLQQLLRLFIQLTIMKPLLDYFRTAMTGIGGGATSAIATGIGAAFAAKGMALQHGVQTFANGGVVNRPTFFPMKRKLGLMGEAGPEAILPLERGPGGVLGVRSTGGGSMQNNFSVAITVNGGSDPQKTAALTSDATIKAVRGLIRQELADSQRVGGQLNPI